MEMMDDESDPSRDPRVVTAHSNYTEYDLEGHRACTMYIGLHCPLYRRKSHHKHRHHHRQHRTDFIQSIEFEPDIAKPVTPPSERVHFILGEEEDGTHEPHPLFSEMEELFRDGDDVEWRETARWVKFEEDVEEGGNRWSKPHVATISLHSLFELRSCILNGTIMLDINASSLNEIADLILEGMVSSEQIQPKDTEKLKEILMHRHRHQHEMHFEWEWGDRTTRLPLIRSLTEIGRTGGMFNSHNIIHLWGSFAPNATSGAEEVSFGNSASTGVLEEKTANSLNLSMRGANVPYGRSCSADDTPTENFIHKMNQSFMKKIPPESEASNLLVGEHESVDKIVSAFVRLNESCILGDLTEVPIPTRFIFILLGPVGQSVKYHEIGRAMATLLSDEVFHGVAYKAKTRQDLLAGVDEFLDATTVLPPGVWDPSTRIEPPPKTVSQESRIKPDPIKENVSDPPASTDGKPKSNDLQYSGRLFGGLVADVRRKLPWFRSDIMDGIAVQCIASVMFLYFACIAQIITFGELLARVTKQRMASVECLQGAVICGTVYALTSGQPLTLLGSTGPAIIFESMVADMCEYLALDFLSMRTWIGLWTSAWLLVMVALDVSILVRYITRFTQEIFATLSSAFFIYKALDNIMQIGSDFPLKTKYSTPIPPPCICLFPSNDFSTLNLDSCQIMNGTLKPHGCSIVPPFIEYVADVFLLSGILFAGTITVIFMIRALKNTPFFTTKVRNCISNFSIVVAVTAMTLLDYFIALPTPKLEVPDDFKPTSRESWLVPFVWKNPWWSAILAAFPALLFSVLVFMDQHITTVIVNRSENKLQKGFGYHLDLFVVAILIAICSVLGLPWFVAATVLSVTHVNSLTYVSRSPAPGEAPYFNGVREQRCTHFCVFMLIGLSTLHPYLLRLIPMPVMYGVFFFMGVTSLKGMQFFDRILLMFMPAKYQPDYTYLRHVPLKIVHCYTVLQIIILGVLFGFKLFRITSYMFPFLLIGLLIVRKCLMYVFKENHLQMLDYQMPEPTSLDGKGRAKHSSHGQMSGILSEVGDLNCACSKGTMKSNDSNCNINISEVLTQSSMWKSIDFQAHKSQKKSFLPSKCKKKKNGGKRRLSVMEEVDEEHLNNATTAAATAANPSPSQPPPSASCTIQIPPEASSGTVV